jgi:hypothetical protein
LVDQDLSDAMPAYSHLLVGDAKGARFTRNPARKPWKHCGKDSSACLNSVRGVHQPAHIRIKRIDGNHFRPSAPPALADRRVFFDPKEPHPATMARSSESFSLTS